ncbi:MAG: hypothetical protein U5N86_00040 [Planctomycetota bacterium]|nr:hypothetical protein [Planctomycetota bacterium]
MKNMEKDLLVQLEDLLRSIPLASSAPEFVKALYTGELELEHWAQLASHPIGRAREIAIKGISSCEDADKASAMLWPMLADEAPGVRAAAARAYDELNSTMFSDAVRGGEDDPKGSVSWRMQRPCYFRSQARKTTSCAPMQFSPLPASTTATRAARFCSHSWTPPPKSGQPPQRPQWIPT